MGGPRIRLRPGVKTPPMGLGWRTSLAAFALVTGCGSGGPATNGPGPLCNKDGDCAAGLACVSLGGLGQCEQPCRSSSDCASGKVCTVSSPAFCAAACTGSGRVLDMGPCVNGVPTSCASITDGSYCDVCLDSCTSSQRCDAISDHCIDLSAVGGPCTANSDCASANCGSLSGTPDGGALQCFVKAGAACTTENCGSCVVTGSTTACDQSCTAPDDGSCGAPGCPEGKTPVCFAGSGGGFYCRQPCPLIGCPDGYACNEYTTPPLCSSPFSLNACFPMSLAQPPAPQCTMVTTDARPPLQPRGPAPDPRRPRRRRQAPRFSARHWARRTGPRSIVATGHALRMRAPLRARVVRITRAAEA